MVQLSYQKLFHPLYELLAPLLPLHQVLGTLVVNEVISRFGGVDILVNVVGGSSAPSGGFSVLSDVEWQKELNINLMTAVRLDRVCGEIKTGT
jgi:hypothetical protein